MNSHRPDLGIERAIQRRLLLDRIAFRALLSRKRGSGSDVERILNQPSWPLESLKRFVLLFVCSLALGLACSELPELLTLSDDSSNDSIESSSAPRVEILQTTRQEAERWNDTFPPRRPFSTFLTINCPQPALPSGTDLLQLLSLQRK